MIAKTYINFGQDKSQILRGVAIIFMIILHNGADGLFKICVPIFSFLVGYGYAFAKEKDLRHAFKRSWNLLSHFWLILFGLFVPVAIWKGDWKPELGELLANMFGLESQLNWYSWYIYFYIYAMLVMIPVAKIIVRYKVIACLILTVLCFIFVYVIHQIPLWSNNIWLQAIHDCFLCSPVMFTGFYLAEGGGITRIRIKDSLLTLVLFVCLAIFMFFIRGLKYIGLFDFITIPVFVTCVIAIFNIVKWRFLTDVLAALGKESMNMWFLHALFATSYTAIVFAPLISWIKPKPLMVIVMVIVSFFAAKFTNAVYNQLAK